jgi:hypothetical protein
MILAAEAWESVLFAGLIPILGAAGIGFLIWFAVREKPEEEGREKKEKEGQGPSH